MGLSSLDTVFIILVLGLLVLILYLYRRNKKSMKTNIGEILDEYEKLKEITEKLRRDADGIIAQTRQAEGTHESLKSESAKLKDALYDVRQESKAEIDKAINDMKKRMKGELTKEIEGMLPKVQPKVEMKNVKELALQDEHINILSKLASVESELSLKVLFDHFSSSFPNKPRKVFEVAVRELTEDHLIREAYADAGDFYYTISNQGVLRLKRTVT